MRIIDKSFKVKVQPLVYKGSGIIYPLLGVYPKEINFLEEYSNLLPKDWKFKK